MRLRVLATAGVAALVLTACGTDADTPDDGAVTPSPTATSTATPTATPTAPATDEVTDPASTGDAQSIAQAVDATIAEGSAAFDVVVDVAAEGASESVTSSGVIDFTGDRRQLDIGEGDATLNTIISQDGILISVADAAWVRVDPRDLQGTPLETYGLATLPLQDPAVNLALLRGATDDVVEHGDTDLDGETTTHYEITVDVEQAAAQADPQTAATIETLGADAGTVDMEVWIDGEDRIRRISHQADLSSIGQAGTDPATQDLQGTIDVTVDMYDFGTEVQITEPDEAQVLDIDEQTLQQLLGELGGTAAIGGTTGATATATATATPTPDADPLP